MGMDVWALRTGEDIGNLNASPPERYFRDSYGPRSLANWITRNIDPTARGSWGLAIFTEPDLPVNSAEWCCELVRLSTGWCEEARRLDGRTTLAGYPEDGPLIVGTQETHTYVEHCERLQRFAETVVKEGLQVVVSA